jgi:hypothetical protein
MIKMRQVIEIKLRAVGVPAHNDKPYSGANRCLRSSAKTGDTLRKLMRLVRSWHIFYRPSARDNKLAVEFGRWRG